MIYLLKMVIFHSFVSLPEGTQYDPVICCGCDLWIGGLIISILGIGLDFFFRAGMIEKEITVIMINQHYTNI